MSSPLQDLLDDLERWSHDTYWGTIDLLRAYRRYKDTLAQNTNELDLANLIDSRTFTVGNTQNKVDAIMQLLNGGNYERTE